MKKLLNSQAFWHVLRCLALIGVWCYFSVRYNISLGDGFMLGFLALMWAVTTVIIEDTDE